MSLWLSVKTRIMWLFVKNCNEQEMQYVMQQLAARHMIKNGKNPFI